MQNPMALVCELSLLQVVVLLFFAAVIHLVYRRTK